MLEQSVVLKAVEDGKVGYDRKVCNMLGNWDFRRLVDFFTFNDLNAFGFQAKKDTDGSEWKQRPWTEEEVKSALKSDIKFASKKLKDLRGISTILMMEVINMWLWILEDPLLEQQCELCNKETEDTCGKEFFEAVAKKYEVQL